MRGLGQFTTLAAAFCGALSCGCGSRDAPGESASSPPAAAPEDETPVRLTVSRTATLRATPRKEDREALRAQLKGDTMRTARVTVEGVHFLKDQSGVTSVRVFAEMPEADVRTPVDDEHYIGSFAPYLTAPENLELPVSPFLRRRGEREWRETTPEAIRFTFVLNAQPGSEPEVEISRVSLRFSPE